jgi:hypothetical protein
MVAASSRVERIVSLVAELTPEERAELAQGIEVLEIAADPTTRTRVSEAIRRVIRDHRSILEALSK